jgi:uncharacterized membrane protein
MNQEAFLRELESRLRGLPREERDNALEYYREYFLDAGLAPDADVTASVGSAAEVARRILEECTTKQLAVQTKEGGAKNTAKSIWLVILGIFAAPIALPLAIVAVVLVFVILVVIFAVLFALFVSGAAIVLAGIVLIVALFWVGGIGQRLVAMGCGLILIALGILICLGIIKLTQLVTRGMAKSIQNKRNKGEKEHA